MSLDPQGAKSKLHHIASHAHNLAMGLQNAAPAQSTMSPSIKYLLEISIQLEKLSQQVEADDE